MHMKQALSFSPTDIEYYDPLRRGDTDLTQTWAGEGARANSNEHALALIFLVCSRREVVG